MHNVFVYGTLLQGYGNHRLMPGARFLGHGMTKGVMYNLGNFPAVVQADGSVYGEVYAVDDSILETLDHLEGHPQWYYRELVDIKTDDGNILQAWIYFMPEEKLHSDETVPSGDWILHRCCEQEEVLYFAYGSNRNPERMNKREVSFSRRSPGLLLDYRLVFNKAASRKEGEGYANVVPAECEETGGHLYRIAGRDISKLDRYEGWPGHYYRRFLPIVTPAREEVFAVTYIAARDKCREGLKPSDEYVRHCEWE